MFAKTRFWPILVAVHLFGSVAFAQTTPPAGKEQIPPPVPPPTALAEKPPPADAIAAVVNGQPIAEMAVFRGLLRVHPDHRDKVRPEVVNYLVDNLVVDQYLTQLKIDVPVKDVDDNVEKIRAQAKKSGKDLPEMLKTLHLTEDEFRRELTSALKWDKFVMQQGTDKVLHDMFDQNVEMFNGSKVLARHILIKPGAGGQAEAEAKVLQLKKQIEAEVAAELAKLPPTSDKITVEKERAKVLEKTFMTTASKESTCPSKNQGGDLGYFPRVGAMVEPFARAAFVLKPFQMSDPVLTEFGVHLILNVDYRPGRDVKFEEVKPFVQEVYGERLREAVLKSYKPKSKIEIRAKPAG
jgi:parvulin-like peptidyl-prolyl isomerase